MPLFRAITTVIIFISLFIACQNKEVSNNEIPLAPLSDTVSVLESELISGISKTGKMRSAARLSNIYTPISLDTFAFPIVDDVLLQALYRQRRLLKIGKKRYNQSVGNLQINHSELSETIDILERWQNLIPVGIGKELNAYQVRGKDHRGNVKFTAYFSPVIPVSKRRTVIYRYPIRSKPKGFSGKLPSRRAIESGALDSVTQHLAYAVNKAEIYYMQLQGSGYIEYQNGERELLSYNGQNGYPYRSIETYLAGNSSDFGIRDISMEGVKKYIQRNPHLTDSILNQNPSYVFFRKSKTSTTGAGNVPLTAGISMAVDPRYIPLGSCFLAAVPVVDKQNNVIRHEYKILLAQDTGGAIKGTGHIDLYFGVGKEAQKAANNFNHYGRLMLLLPKKQKHSMVYTANLSPIGEHNSVLKKQ